ncbi:MAG: FAD-binding protein [Myxococcales bacterium]|nr:MAG: FAD-binding protein [Myxococcales bacterium]
MEQHDALVIGAGFGGLAAALTLAEQGVRVLVCESLRYAGGCASTFSRQGYRFESGATLFAGFGPGQPFARWIERHRMPVTLRTPDPMVELRAPGLTLPVRPDRAELEAQLAALPGAPVAALHAFFAQQRAVADALWALFDEPELLPPFSPAMLLRHAARVPRYLPLLPLIGRPLGAVVASHGLAGFEPLRIYLDAVCQITVQTSSAEAEAPFALSAGDYYFRGTRHVHGGIGELAGAMVEAIRQSGGEVRLSDRVKALRPVPGGYEAETRRGPLRARVVGANLLPQALAALLGPDERAARLDELTPRVEQGWGAAMLYLALRPDAALRPEAHHLELVADPSRPFTEGNHVFCSISGVDEPGRGPHDERTATVSTHVPMATLLALPESERGAYIAAIQARMEATLRSLAPAVLDACTFRLPASPRTFARFTGRTEGYVGGLPRRAGLHNYAGMGQPPVRPGLFLLGDTVFPGQSTLAVALGGQKIANRMLDLLR